MEEDPIAGNLEKLRSRIENKCISIDRDPAEIKIVGVSKTFPASMVEDAVKAGLKDIGENRVQEGITKITAVQPRPVWHFIGHLQRNKAGRAVEYFDVIQSVDSLELAEKISQKALDLGKKTEIYLQLNSSEELQKSGFYPAEILDNADKIIKLPGLRATGLMTIGPLTEDEDLIKRSFSLTKEFFHKLKSRISDQIKWLSMGMSGDFELALEYEANVLRIGTAIFGPRKKT
jgi:pyridoxal phosphate enzyme (YggS family)